MGISGTFLSARRQRSGSEANPQPVAAGARLVLTDVSSCLRPALARSAALLSPEAPQAAPRKREGRRLQ